MSLHNQPGLALADLSGQQIFVVTDPTQLEMIQVNGYLIPFCPSFVYVCSKSTQEILYMKLKGIVHLRGGAAASSLGSAVSCRVEGRAIDTALGQCFIPNSSH